MGVRVIERERKRVRLTLENLNGQESDWKDQAGGSKKVCLMKGEKTDNIVLD